MAIDSASGTSPRSSRATIFSSSSSAFSKLSSPTATGVFSGISGLVFLDRHQRLDVGCNRVGKRLQVIASFEEADNPTAGMAVGDVHEHAGGRSVVLFLEIQGCQRIAPMGVEAGRND